VNCRLYHPRDFARLYAIEEECFQTVLRFSWDYLRRLVRKACTATWIAEDEGEMAGFAIVDWALKKDRILAYIQTIEVAPGFRGRGIGRELLRRSEASAREAGAELIWLHVDENNSVAIRLYEEFGYRQSGRKEQFYPNGNAALICKKPLDEGLSESSA
jgi:ribosomal protein S18 acetylase RimI-like enzyme